MLFIRLFFLAFQKRHFVGAFSPSLGNQILPHISASTGGCGIWNSAGNCYTILLANLVQGWNLQWGIWATIRTMHYYEAHLKQYTHWGITEITMGTPRRIMCWVQYSRFGNTTCFDAIPLIWFPPSSRTTKIQNYVKGKYLDAENMYLGNVEFPILVR